MPSGKNATRLFVSKPAAANRGTKLGLRERIVCHEGKLASVAQSGAKAPDIPGGVFFDFSRPTINDAGDIAFLTTVRRGRETLQEMVAAAREREPAS